MFYNEIKFGKPKAPSHQSGIAIRESSQISQGRVIGSDKKNFSIEIATKVFCCTHERK